MNTENYSGHVPYLRRFARAFTGSQSIGDLYVKMALQILGSDQKSSNSHIPRKILLFRAFIRAWSDTGVNSSDVTVLEHCPADRVRRLALCERQAFVLSALENFGNSEIAEILEVSNAKVAELLEGAELAIQNELVTSVLIIEDEPIIATDIQAMVEELGHTVCGTAATHKDAMSVVRQEVPGIVLSDVKLADGSSGIDAVSEILEQFCVPIIFVTAYPEKLLTGDRSEPTYLISKPFEAENLKAAISQALFFHVDERSEPHARTG